MSWEQTPPARCVRGSSSSSERVLLGSVFLCSVLIGTPLPWGETWTFLPDLACVFGGEDTRSNREPFRLSISTVTLWVICLLAGGGSAVPPGNGGPIFLRSTAASRFLWVDRSDQTAFAILKFLITGNSIAKFICANLQTIDPSCP